MGRPPGAIGRETAQRIRDASLQLFARHGYAAVSMREIASEVGVGPGALYNHFATKQDLLADLMARHFSCLASGWAGEPASAADTPPAEALEGFARFHLRYHAANADEVSVAYMELRSLEPPNFHRFDHLRRTYEDQLVSILERGAKAGVFIIEDARTQALAILAMLTGMNAWFRRGDRARVTAKEEIYVGMVMRTVAA